MTETPQQTPPPPPGPQAPPQGWNTENLKDYRSLRRSRTDRKLAGVAGGLGRHLDVDPTILRVLFVVLVFFGGAGLLMYGALWLLVPEEGTEESVVRTSDSTRNLVLIVVAVIAGLAAIGDMWNGYGFPWPIAVAGLVVAVVLLARDRSHAAPPAAGPMPPPPPGTSTGTWAPPPYASPYASSETAPSEADGTTDTQVLPPQGPPQGPPPAWYPPVPPAPARPRRTGPLLFGITLAVVALALGVLGMYDAAGNTVEDAAYPALALAVVGAMLVVGAFVGRAGGLILLGIIASLALGGASLSEPTYDGERDLVARPASSADLASAYEVPAGRIELDLTRLTPEELDSRLVELDVNVGEIVVIVPDDVNVLFDARIDYGGAIETPVGNRDGWGPRLTSELEAASDARADLELDIDMNWGHIEVRQS